MKNFSVLMLDGEGDISLFVARSLGQIPGVKLHVLSREKWAPLRFSRHRSSFQLLSEKDDTKWLTVIKEAVRQSQCDIILPIAEPAVRFVSTHKAYLAKLTHLTPTPNVNMFDKTVNKWWLMDLLSKNDIPCPRTILVTDDDAFKHSMSQLPFPVLLKPVRGSDGKGIRFFDNIDSLVKTVEKDSGFADQYIVQNYIDGHDIDCNVLCQDGEILAHTIQKGFIFRGRRFAPPAGIQFVQDKQVLDVVKSWVFVTRWNGVAHLDLRYDKQDGQVKIIEVNARYWGSLLGSLVAGVNFPYLACLVGLGTPFAKPDYKLKKYVSGNAAVKSGLRQLLGQAKNKLTFEETSWQFALMDPLAELFKLVRQSGLF